MGQKIPEPSPRLPLTEGNMKRTHKGKIIPSLKPPPPPAPPHPSRLRVAYFTEFGVKEFFTDNPNDIAELSHKFKLCSVEYET